MVQLWFISDTHFGHANMLTFKQEGGDPVRPFHHVTEMDEAMIQRWNERVRPQDHVYHLGDVAIHKNAMDAIMPRLAGHKRLIRGNHDIFKTRSYLRWFGEIHGSRLFERALLFTHIPVHERSLKPEWVNVHGHTHLFEYDGPYLNICVEKTDYAPLSLEEVRARAERKRQA